MQETQPSDEVRYVRQCLARLSEDKSILHPAARALELIAHSSTGLGEVLQDYARQTSRQLRRVIDAAGRVAAGELGADHGDAIYSIHTTLKNARMVLEMAPAAMRRNKAESIGDKEKYSVRDVIRILDEFSHSPDVEPLLIAEDAGEKWMHILAPESAGLGMENGLRQAASGQ